MHALPRGAQLARPHRRSEIGLRRARGATRGQIRAQFLAEAILLSLAGGLASAVVIGALAGLLPAIRAARLSPAQALLTAWRSSCGRPPLGGARLAAVIFSYACDLVM